jgi:glycine cleavage system H protein
MYPEDLKYAKSHEWIKMEGEKVRMGVTDYAQKELGDIVFVELPEKGKKLEAGSFGVIESVKTVSDLHSPLKGEVIEVNEELAATPELVNQDPYGKGWMIVVKFEDKSELDSLMNSEEYEKFTASK